MRLGWVRTGSASNGLACSGFQTKLLGSLHRQPYTVSSKNVAGTLLSDDISFIGYSVGFPEKGECEIALGLRSSFYRKKPLLQLRYLLSFRLR